MTDVTIRGIDDEVYSLFSAEARKKGVSIGELVTVVMRAFLGETAHISQDRISDMDVLEVSEKDLKSLTEKIAFSDIAKLEFKSDVSWESFVNHVSTIEDVEKLTCPKSFPKLALLTKCKNIGKLIQL